MTEPVSVGASRLDSYLGYESEMEGTASAVPWLIERFAVNGRAEALPSKILEDSRFRIA